MIVMASLESTDVTFESNQNYTKRYFTLRGHDLLFEHLADWKFFNSVHNFYVFMDSRMSLKYVNFCKHLNY